MATRLVTHGEFLNGAIRVQFAVDTVTFNVLGVRVVNNSDVAVGVSLTTADGSQTVSRSVPAQTTAQRAIPAGISRYLADQIADGEYPRVGVAVPA